MKKIKKYLIALFLVLIIGGCSCSNSTCECPENEDNVSDQYENVITDYTKLFEKTTRSVVKIVVSKGGYIDSTGSGVVFFEQDDTAYVLTNAHVVSKVNSSYNVEVIFSDENGFESGESELVDIADIYKNTDEDVAVLEIPKSNKYEKVTLGDSDDLNKGEFVYTIGSPFGRFNYTSSGSLTSYNVPVKLENSNVYNYVIVSDAPINSGNSGGALFDSEGKLIGITTFRYDFINESSVSDMYGSLPINHVIKVAQSLIAKGAYTRPSLNLQTKSINEMGVLRASYGISNSVKSGVYVIGSLESNILPESIIVEVNGNTVKSVNEFESEILKYDVNQTIVLTLVTKDGLSSTKVSVTLHA